MRGAAVTAMPILPGARGLMERGAGQHLWVLGCGLLWVTGAGARAGTMPAAEWVAVRGIMLGFCRAYLSRAQPVPARLNGIRKSD